MIFSLNTLPPNSLSPTQDILREEQGLPHAQWRAIYQVQDVPRLVGQSVETRWLSMSRR